MSIMDDNDCMIIDSFTVTEPDTIIIMRDIIESGCDDTGLGGTITLNPSGGCGGFTYLWPTGDTGNSVSGLDAGTYEISVTDACDCEVIETIDLTGTSALVGNALDVTQIDCAGELVCIGVDPSSVSGGTGFGYTYSINFGNRLPIDTLSLIHI